MHMQPLTPATFSPTPEQLYALEMASQRQSFKIMAYAGTGKTKTLELIGNRLGGRGLYLAFNRRIAQEAQGRFGSHVRAQTFHSLAFAHTKRTITAKLTLDKPTPGQLAKEYRLTPISVTRAGKQVTLSPNAQGGYLIQGLRNFCKTHARAPHGRHLELPVWLLAHEEDAIRAHLAPMLMDRWLQCIDERHPGGIEHDIYMKLWSLSNPVLPFDFVMFDEAQDADPLMMGVLLQQNTQVIYTGDSHQQIYEWRGAKNAMTHLPLPHCRLTQSFRFGAHIAKTANVFLRALGEKVPLVGCNKPDMVEAQTDVDAKLYRTNAGAVDAYVAGLKAGERPKLDVNTQGFLSFFDQVDALRNQGRSWGELASFDTWGDVVEFSQSPEGVSFASRVKLVETYETAFLRRIIQQNIREEEADYVICTAHKSKGLEWSRVALGDDFHYTLGKDTVTCAPESLRLLYVGVTRAKRCLDASGIDDLLSTLPHAKLYYQ